MRKDKGFEVLDNIYIYVTGNPTVEAIVKKFEETIKHDTLAVDVLYGEDRDGYSDVNINGEVVKLDVEKV